MGLELLSSKKKVLAGVSGIIPYGNLVAVMGPSGAGKTTFLTTLCGKVFSSFVVFFFQPLSPALEALNGTVCSFDLPKILRTGILWKADWNSPH